MFTYDSFKETFYPQKKHWGSFAEHQLADSATHLPAEVIEFLRLEGLSSYSNNFLWTTLPGNFYSVLSQWGLKGESCHVFIRSAFGTCVYYSKNKFYYLDPIEGRIISLGDDFYLMLNYMLTLDAILDSGFFKDYYQNIVADRDSLQPEEVFAFVPAIALGGSIEKSKIEIMNLREHLQYLAQLFDNKVTKIH